MTEKEKSSNACRTTKTSTFLEKNIPYLCMKIKYIFPLIFLWAASSWAGGNCDYLKSIGSVVDSDQPTQFNYLYNQYYCEATDPILKDATLYVQWIKNTKGKTIVEVVHDVGNTFCRAYFGDCGDKSFYYRFTDACATARDNAIKNMPAGYQIANADTTFLLESFSQCQALADNVVQAYKEASLEEVARYSGKIIEASNQKYLDQSHEKMNTLANIMNTLFKMVSNVGRSFEGFTSHVYGGR